MTDRTLKTKISKLQELQREIDNITAEAEAIKDAIKTEMNKRNIEEFEAARYKSFPTSRLDGKALKADMPELYDKYCKTTESARFTLARA